VIHSVNRIKTDKRSLQAENFRDVTEMEAPDDYTVVFTTEVPNAVFLDRLYNRFMISKASADKYGDQADEHPNGTGPYKFVSWQRDGNLVMTRNDDYWGPKPAIKEIVIKRSAKTRRGSPGFWRTGRRHQQRARRRAFRLEKHPRVRAEKVEGLRMHFLAMNLSHKPFDNKLVRQAFNYAVDPAQIIKHIFEGNGYVMNGPMSSNVIGFDPKVRRYPYDPRRPKILSKAVSAPAWR
jgi:ABC-type transport system substrate-binding protein